MVPSRAHVRPDFFATQNGPRLGGPRTTSLCARGCSSQTTLIQTRHTVQHLHKAFAFFSAHRFPREVQVELAADCVYTGQSPDVPRGGKEPDPFGELDT